MYICSMLHLCIIAILSEGLILNSGWSYVTFGSKIPVFRANIQGTFWIQNSKNDGFTKMSVELRTSHILPHHMDIC